MQVFYEENVRLNSRKGFQGEERERELEQRVPSREWIGFWLPCTTLSTHTDQHGVWRVGEMRYQSCAV